MPLGVLYVFFPLICWIELAFEPLDARNSWSRLFFSLLAATPSYMIFNDIYVCLKMGYPYIHWFITIFFMKIAIWKAHHFPDRPTSDIMLITRVLRAEMSTEQTCRAAAQRMCFQRCAALTKSAVVRYQTDFAGTTWYMNGMVVEGVSMKMAVDSCKHARLLLQLV